MEVPCGCLPEAPAPTPTPPAPAPTPAVPDMKTPKREAKDDMKIGVVGKARGVTTTAVRKLRSTEEEADETA